MASVFSLSVPFNGQQYKALVNIQQQHCDLVCIVRYVDRELQRVFSGQSLVFSLLEGLKQPKTLQGRLAEDLVFNTTQAISRYLQVKECIGEGNSISNRRS